MPDHERGKARLRRLLWPSVFLLAAGLEVGRADGPPPLAPQTLQTPAPARTGQRPIFRTTVELVTQDVIVRDAKGRFIADLKAGDFEVLEDDVAQQLESMVLILGGRTYNQMTPRPPAPQEGIVVPPPQPTSDAAGRIFLLFVDDLHLDASQTPRIRDFFKKISTTLIHEGDLFAIQSTGPSSVAVDLTYDRSRLDEAIQRISGSGLKPTDVIQGAESAEGPPEVRYRAHVAFSTAYDLMKQLEQVHNRRKAVIYVSNGYDFNPFPEARKGESRFFEGRFGQTREEADVNPFLRQGQQFAEADLVRDLAELTRTANRANATIYAIDPRGLVAGPGIDEQVDPHEWHNNVRTTTDSLRVLAEETGGIAVVNQNDFAAALRRIDNESSDYYVLGYYSTNPDPTRRTRRIDVRVRRAGASTVTHRTAYSLKPPGAPDSRR